MNSKVVFIVVIALFVFPAFCFGEDLSHIRSLEEFGLIVKGGSCKIKKKVNLEGGTLELPKGVSLVFTTTGMIKNGTIIGNFNSLNGSSKKIFDNIEIKGTWNVAKINSRMFVNCSSSRLFSNLTNLSSDRYYNLIVIEDEFIVDIPLWTSYLVLKSNTDLYLKANIKAMPSPHKGGWLITVKGKNIRIFGGGNLLQGDVLEQRDNRPQCLHAIFVDRTSSNVLIEDLVMQYFWGDGISSQGSDVVYKKLEVRYNGRQGISITNGERVFISNCFFHDMGFAGINEAKGPGAGIDIEPGNDMNVDDVVISECVIINNYKYFHGYVNDLEIYNTKKINLKVQNCIIGGLYLGSCENIELDNTIIKESVYFINDSIAGIKITDCSLPQGTPLSEPRSSDVSGSMFFRIAKQLLQRNFLRHESLNN